MPWELAIWLAGWLLEWSIDVDNERCSITFCGRRGACVACWLTTRICVLLLSCKRSHWCSALLKWRLTWQLRAKGDDFYRIIMCLSSYGVHFQLIYHDECDIWRYIVCWVNDSIVKEFWVYLHQIWCVVNKDQRTALKTNKTFEHWNKLIVRIEQKYHKYLQFYLETVRP